MTSRRPSRAVATEDATGCQQGPVDATRRAPAPAIVPRDVKREIRNHPRIGNERRRTIGRQLEPSGAAIDVTTARPEAGRAPAAPKPRSPRSPVGSHGLGARRGHPRIARIRSERARQHFEGRRNDDQAKLAPNSLSPCARRGGRGEHCEVRCACVIARQATAAQASAAPSAHSRAATDVTGASFAPARPNGAAPNALRGSTAAGDEAEAKRPVAPSLARQENASSAQATRKADEPLGERHFASARASSS